MIDLFAPAEGDLFAPAEGDLFAPAEGDLFAPAIDPAWRADFDLNDDDPLDAAPPASLEQVQGALAMLPHDQGVMVLQRYGVTRASDMLPMHHGKAFAHCRHVLAGGAP